VTINQEQVFQAMELAIANAHEVLEMSLQAQDQASLCEALAARFDISLDQADVIGSVQFKRLTGNEQERVRAALAANRPPG